MLGQRSKSCAWCCLQAKKGVLNVQDGHNQVHTVQLVLYPDALLIQKEEWVNMPLEDEDEVFLNMVRLLPKQSSSVCI